MRGIIKVEKVGQRVRSDRSKKGKVNVSVGCGPGK